MRGLLLKEWYILKQSVTYLFVVGFIFLGFSLTPASSNISIGATLPIIFVTQIVSTFTYDETSKFSVYALTLPIDKQKYVSAKYVVSALLLCFSAVLEAVFLLVYYFVQNELPSVLIFNVGVFLYAGILFGFILMPFIFRYGPEKTRILIYLLFLLLFFLGGLLSGLIKYQIVAFGGVSLLGIVLLAVAALAMLGAASYRLSIKWFVPK